MVRELRCWCYELLRWVHHMTMLAGAVPERCRSEPAGHAHRQRVAGQVSLSALSHAKQSPLLPTPAALLTITISASQAAFTEWHQQCRPVGRRYMVAVVDKVEWQAAGSQPQYRRGGSNLWAAHEVLQVLTDRVCAAAVVRLQMESHCYACPLSCCQQRGQAVVS